MDYLIYIERNVMMLNKFEFKFGGKRNIGPNKAYENMSLQNIKISFVSNDILDCFGGKEFEVEKRYARMISLEDGKTKILNSVLSSGWSRL